LNERNLCPESAASISSAAFAEQEAHVERLKSRLDALEYENGRLRSSLDELRAASAETANRTDADVGETRSLRDRVSTLEECLRATEASYDEGVSEISTLQNGLADLERQRDEREQDLAELGAKVAECTAQVEGMNEAIELKEARERELESILEAKSVEIVALKEHVDNLSAQFEDERQELGIQINELRQAGQVSFPTVPL
jgi:CAP-Gly domain-containing linker protein 1